MPFLLAHRLRLLTALGAATLLAAIPARAETHAELTEIKDGKSAPVTDWNAHHEWKWTQAEGGIPVLQSLITLSPTPASTASGEGPAIKGVTTSGSKWLKNSKKTAGGLQLLVPKMSEEAKVTFQSGSPRTFAISLKSSPGEVVSQGCAPFNLELARVAAPDTGKKPFYLGLACSSSKQGSVVTITAPKDVSWGSTTIFEVAGKGEQWRQYLLGKAAPGAKGEIARLSFSFGGAQIPYQLIDRKAADLAENVEGSESDERIVRFRIGGGAGRLAVSSARISDSLYHLGVSVDAETKKFFKVVKAEVGLDLALPLQTGSLGGDFFDIQAALLAELRAGSFTVAPGLFFMSMLGHYASGTLAYQFNQPGFGLELRWLRPRGSYVMLRASSSGALPSSSNTFLGLLAGYRFAQGPLGRFGIDLVYRGVSLADPVSGNDTMSESLLNFVWSI